MPQLVWTATAEGKINYYNKAIGRFWPSQDTATGEYDWRDIIHPDDLDRTQQEWNSAAAAVRDYSCSHRLRMGDGSYRWHLSRAIPQRQVSDTEIMWFGTATDIDELKQAEHDHKLLLEELNHRVKNTLALVQGIATLTFRSFDHPAASLSAFHARLAALAKAHDLLVRDHWQAVTLKEIVATTVGALGVAVDRITATGDDVRLSGRTGVMVAMAMHELSTNAVKYGALSNEKGSVIIRWNLLDTIPGGFEIHWKETGGPIVQPPTCKGFGSRLIQQALASMINGEALLDFQPEGLSCTIRGRDV